MVNGPQLTNWIVTYDANGMPGLVTGKVSDDCNTFSAGQHIHMNVFTLDLKKQVAVDYDGIVFHLTGPGAQAIITDHLEPFDFVEIHDTDNDDDPYDPEE